ncbi:hypothetical protein FOZ60_009197 [Perkinsus olseni]|uniref:Uncharacterized protein n=1 Tax=Perkinsus olseni TaxID=32597 RepID=A0A7J6PD19_PEROL|nr:hypothetical protein FOZ60_009197 [Perkinsus olseni]
MVPRRLYDTPISYPADCTGDEGPATEPFCVTGSFNTSGGFKLNITVYIFDVDDPKKSVNFHIEMANNNTTPTGLNVTGGGSAKVVKKEELFGAVELSVTMGPISKVVTAHIGPHFDFGLEAIFEESTGDSDDAGISIAFDLTMNTKNHDLFTWEIVGEGKLHIWWKPAIDLTPTIDVFNK